MADNQFVSKFKPEMNKTYLMDHFCLLQIIAGKGSIEVDFNLYFDWQDKLIYLAKGQYIRFLSESFEVRKIDFPDEVIFNHQEVRVLFKHLVSLGYINFDECQDCQRYLSHTIFSNTLTDIIDISSEQWYWQNPFNAQRDEYHLIFDVKDLVDDEYTYHLSNRELADRLAENGYRAQALVKNKIGLSVKGLLGNKRLLESKKQIAFTDKHIQQIAYELGYKDPAYFNRVFKQQTGKSPVEFRKDFDFEQKDLFLQDLLDLLHTHHQQERSLEFYANKMHLSVKALTRKVKDKLNVSLGQLIRRELVQSAKSLLMTGQSVQEVAFQLGFEEPNHFSRFFKQYTRLTPSQFKAEKYKQ